MVLSDLITYHRGIWSWFEVVDMSDEPVQQQLRSSVEHDCNIDRHRAAMSLFGDFPLPTFTGGLTTRTYPTWEEFSDKSDASILPDDRFATQWSTGEDGWDIHLKDEALFYLPPVRSVFSLQI